MVDYVFYFNRKSLKNKRFNQIGLIIGMLVMVYIAVYIGQNRIGSNTSNNLSVMMNAMGEMGFNFTSICFVMDYVPSMTGFKLGFTYFKIQFYVWFRNHWMCYTCLMHLIIYYQYNGYMI